MDGACNMDWAWKLDSCKQAVCLLQVGGNTKTGTGFVVRNDAAAALVTARHVLEGSMTAGEGGVDGEVTGHVTAMVQGREEVDLIGARVLLVPAEEGDGANEPPDVAVVFLPAERRFPARPVPCELTPACADDVSDDGLFTLLHHPSGAADLVVEARGQLVRGESSAAAAAMPWIVRYQGATAAGSSGGMLLDSKCHAFAVHVSAHKSGKNKCAVRLSVVHERLGDASPWREMKPVVHQKRRSFKLPDKPKHFVGRVEAMKLLSDNVEAGGMTVVASTGLPGVGKSMLVTKWAHLQCESGAYSLIVWLRAEHVGHVEADLVELGTELHVLHTRPDGRSMAERAQAVTAFLGRLPGRGTLLVFDNAESFHDLKRFIPLGGCHRCVFTARDASKFPDAAALPLNPFTPGESMLLLGLVSRRDVRRWDESRVDVDIELDAAIDLCAEVGHLPLALHVLAAYAKRSGAGFSDVLKSVRGNAPSARALNVPDLPDYARRESVVGALLTACGELDAANYRTLERLAMLAPDKAPRDLVLGDGAETDRLWDLAIVTYPGPGLLSIHRLVQAVALAQMATDVRQRVADGLVNKLLAMTAGFSKNNCATWTSWQAVAPHTEALLVQPGIETCVGGADNLEDNGRWTLMDGLRNYYTCTSALHAALDIAKALHAEVHSSLGSEHTSTADSQQDIANVLGDLGEYNEALTLCRVVERKRVVALGEDHPSVLTTQHNIAFMLSKLGEYDEALTLYREVARKRVDALGEDHPNVLTTQHNIAGVLSDLGEYDEALKLYRVVVRKEVGALGEDHPSVLTTQHNIAGVLSDLGEYDEALKLYRVVVRKRVVALGEDHSSVLATQSSIAGVLKDLGEYDKALTLYRVVERKSVVALGEDHPSVLHTRHSIAGVLKDLGEYDEALTLYQVVERKRVVALGEDHASVLDTQSSIAGVMKDLGKYNEALKLYRAVEQVCRVDRGARPGSGKAATPHGGLAGCTGQVDEGQQVVDGALARAVAHLGPRHPDAVLYGRTLQSIRAHGRARSGPLPRTFSLTSVLAALLFCVALLIVLFLPWLLAKHG